MKYVELAASIATLLLLVLYVYVLWSYTQEMKLANDFKAELIGDRHPVPVPKRMRRMTPGNPRRGIPIKLKEPTHERDD